MRGKLVPEATVLDKLVLRRQIPRNTIFLSMIHTTALDPGSPLQAKELPRNPVTDAFTLLWSSSYRQSYPPTPRLERTNARRSQPTGVLGHLSKPVFLELWGYQPTLILLKA